MTADRIRAAYDASVAAWVAGPDRVYRRLAADMLAASPIDVSNSRVLDVGAGAGAATRRALELGAAEVIAADLSVRMLRAGPGSAAVRRVAADLYALPFRSGAFDLVIAACCIGHLTEPVRGLAEACRVSRAIVASAFLAGWTHPAKSAVDEAMRAFGFRAPDWYSTFKRHTEPQVDDPDRFRSAAIAAGWRRVDVIVREVPTGISRPEDLVDWRWGMAHLAPFVAALPAERRAAARRAAESAVAGAGELVVPLVILTARRAET